MGFPRKVYGLLSVQLLMTTLIASVCLFAPTVKGTIREKPVADRAGLCL
jgi:FtsH-binding integral membrane protein